MNEEKYFNTILHISNNIGIFDWSEVPTEWYKRLELPHYEPGDMRDCYYFLSNDGLGVAVGSYFSRFYHDEEEYSKSLEHFITFFVKKDSEPIKGIKLFTADEFFEYKRKKEKFSVFATQEDNVIKDIYEKAKEQLFNMDNLLSNLLGSDKE